MAHGKGNRTSGNKKRSGIGSRSGETFKKGPGMDEVLRGEMPANPEAEIEANNSDAAPDELPADSAAVKRRRSRQQ